MVKRYEQISLKNTRATGNLAISFGYLRRILVFVIFVILYFGLFIKSSKARGTMLLQRATNILHLNGIIFDRKIEFYGFILPPSYVMQKARWNCVTFSWRSWIIQQYFSYTDKHIYSWYSKRTDRSVWFEFLSIIIIILKINVY